ncbi:FISUMP domain-containing protein [Fibrobacter sp. UBA2449]|uniref:FISUMP domain-containing protein n=1 Tax=Fibrobacter sp. UBA2449 TaxID=1946529 RepID=UPI0025C5E7B7|nr:FISUMP domain-containing protein [Fibrobacter sp. UBA2449]
MKMLYLMALVLLFMVGCGSDDDFSPVRKNDDAGLSGESSSSSAKSSSSIKQSSSSSSVDGNLESSSSEFRLSTTRTLYPLSPPLTEKGIQFNSDIDYGTMTDKRDGQTYRTVEIDGLTWMAENLNFADSVEYPLLEEGTLCFNDEEANCDVYGRLYNRRAAMNSVRCAWGDSCFHERGAVHQGICPDGWHIPTGEELASLDDLAIELRSAKGWRGTDAYISPGHDTYGFSSIGSGAYCAGFAQSNEGFEHIGESDFFWYTTTSNWQSEYVFYALINGRTNRAASEMYHDELYISVRCVKDY